MKEFSRWYKFDDLFKYIGLTSTSKKDWVKTSALSSGYFLEVSGELSVFNTHNGFIFNENKNFGLKKSSVGLYFLKIFTKETGTKVYIGKSESPDDKHGIPSRLQDHFRKIQVLPSRDRDKLLDLARDPKFGGKGYKLEWDHQKKEFSKCIEELTDKDTNIRDIKKTHGVILGKFKSYSEVADSFALIKSNKSKEENIKWKAFNEMLRDIHKEKIYKPNFWEESCQIAFLCADDILDVFREKGGRESEEKLLKKHIDHAEKLAIMALRKNFDYDDILNTKDMNEPKLICDINKNLVYENFNLNSTHKRSQELILENAEIILKKLKHEELKDWFKGVLESISKSNKDYYLNLSLTLGSDLRIVPTKQRKTAKNFMVLRLNNDHIYCKCILSPDVLNNFFKKNNLDGFVSGIKETPKEIKNIRSAFNIVKLKKNNWLNQLMDDCYDCFNTKYPYKKRKEIITPKYGSRTNGGSQS